MSTAAPIALERAGENPDSNRLFASLIAVKLRFIVPMVVLFAIGYVGVAALAGFDKALASEKVIGPLNLGFVLIGANYVLAWVLTLVYVRVANTRIDPLVEQIAAE